MGALTSRLTLDFNTCDLTMANSVSILEGQSFEVDGFSVGGDVSQQIVKNGLKLAIPFELNLPTSNRVVFETYGIATNFLQDAAVQNYGTLGAQISFRVFGKADSDAGMITVGAMGDFSENYSDGGFRLGGGFKF